MRLVCTAQPRSLSGNPRNYYGGFTVSYLLKAVYYGLLFLRSSFGYRYHLGLFVRPRVHNVIHYICYLLITGTIAGIILLDFLPLTTMAPFDRIDSTRCFRFVCFGIRASSGGRPLPFQWLGGIAYKNQHTLLYH
jgi:hypothetical protein